MRVEWCEDTGTKVMSDCSTLQNMLGQPHVHRWIDVPEPVTYERAKAVAEGTESCPTCHGAGSVNRGRRTEIPFDTWYALWQIQQECEPHRDGRRYDATLDHIYELASGVLADLEKPTR